MGELVPGRRTLHRRAGTWVTANVSISAHAMNRENLKKLPSTVGGRFCCPKSRSLVFTSWPGFLPLLSRNILPVHAEIVAGAP
jgi:hypothetical protein